MEQKNLMPYLLDTVKSYATVGEIVGVLKEVYGEAPEHERHLREGKEHENRDSCLGR